MQYKNESLTSFFKNKMEDTHIPPENKVGGDIGFTLSISVRPSVCAILSGPHLSYSETLEVFTSHQDC